MGWIIFCLIRYYLNQEDCHKMSHVKRTNFTFEQKCHFELLKSNKKRCQQKYYPKNIFFFSFSVLTIKTATTTKSFRKVFIQKTFSLDICCYYILFYVESNRFIVEDTCATKTINN